MSKRQRMNRFASEGGWQAGKQGTQGALVRRILLICLAALTLVMATPAAWALAAPSNEDPTGGGSSPEGITSNPAQDGMTARASPSGDGAFSAWFTDPGEWCVASPASVASEGGWHEAAGSYSTLRLAAAATGGASSTGRSFAAGSYSTLRLAAAGTRAEVAAARLLDNAAGAYGELRLAASKGGADSACAKPSDDPVFGASSLSEAEFYQDQC